MFHVLWGLHSTWQEYKPFQTLFEFQESFGLFVFPQPWVVFSHTWQVSTCQRLEGTPLQISRALSLYAVPFSQVCFCTNLAVLAFLNVSLCFLSSQRLWGSVEVSLSTLHDRNCFRGVMWGSCRAHLIFSLFLKGPTHTLTLSNIWEQLFILCSFLVVKFRRIYQTPITPLWYFMEITGFNYLFLLFCGLRYGPKLKKQRSQFTCSQCFRC